MSAQNVKANNDVDANAIITIDGPSGAGKGTISFKLAQALGYQLLDSGALYRIVGLKAHEAGLIVDDINEDALEELTKSLKIDFMVNKVTNSVDIIVNDSKIGADIRNETVGGYASKVAVFPKVRSALLDLQRNMALRSGLIADGRDMGTVVFPNAAAKVFLTASAKARAERRVQQLEQAGEIANFDEILANIKARDERDENRTTAPSKPADDALVLDSSTMDINTVYAAIKQHCIDNGIVFKS